MVRQRTWIPGPPGPPQHTFTNLHFKDYGGPEEALGYICYQTVQGEFCVLLDTFEDSKHLIWALHDVVIGESAFAGTVRATLLFGSQRAMSVCLRYPIPVGHCQ